MKINDAFLNRTKRFYNKYKIFIDNFDIENKLSKEEYALYVWFSELLKNK